MLKGNQWKLWQRHTARIVIVAYATQHTRAIRFAVAHMCLKGDPQTSRTIRVIVATCMRHDDSRQAVSYSYRRVRLYASSLCTILKVSHVLKMSDEIIKFINLIEEKECLYKNNIQAYSNKNATEKAWSEIAELMNWSGKYRH